MLWTKTVKFSPYVGECDFLIVEKTVRRSGDEVIFRRDLYLADPDAKDGMKLVKRGALYRGDGMSMPTRYVPDEAVA